MDPLCIRYDIEMDPTLSVNTAMSRITGTTLPRDITLSQALERVSQSLLTDTDSLGDIKTKDDLDVNVTKLNGACRGRCVITW